MEVSDIKVGRLQRWPNGTLNVGVKLVHKDDGIVKHTTWILPKAGAVKGWQSATSINLNGETVKAVVEKLNRMLRTEHEQDNRWITEDLLQDAESTVVHPEALDKLGLRG